MSQAVKDKIGIPLHPQVYHRLETSKVKLLKILQTTTALTLLLLALFGTMLARTSKGDKLFKLAQKAESQKDYDHAVDYFDQALATNPKDPGYLMADQQIHAKAGEYHIQQGKLLRQQGKLNEALVEFQKSLLADPSSSLALTEVKTTTQMVKDRRPGSKEVMLTPAERARQELEKRLSSLEGPPQLRPINQLIRSLKMNNQPIRVLYESLGKLAGINVLFDPSGVEGTAAGKNFNLDLDNVTLEEALNYVALETHTFWKPISRNSIFVSSDNETKRQEYQDEIVKVFYVQNASTQAEFTEIFNAVRVGAKLNQGIFQVASQNAILARGSPDAISLVEKLIHDLDKAKPEVAIDIVIMEVSKNKTTTLGASLLGQGGLSLPVTFNPRSPATIDGSSTGTTTATTTTTSTTTTTATTGTTGSTNPVFTVAQLGHLSSADFATSLPSALLQALMTDTSSRILQRPQLRVTDGGKASLKIGEKIPYVSGSLNSAVATTGSIPYATTQFQQIDVGVNIDIDPVHVNGPDDVSMHIKVEISNHNGDVPIAGVNEPIITQRINETVIRMKDGEVGLLGGLSDKENSNSLSGFPGLTNIPVLGYLFGAKTNTKIDDEILIALIPHIVRGPDLSGVGDPGILAGTEHIVRVQRRPDGTLVPLDSDTTPKPVVPFAAPSPPYTPTAPPSTSGAPQSRTPRVFPSSRQGQSPSTQPNQNPPQGQTPPPEPSPAEENQPVQPTPAEQPH